MAWLSEQRFSARVRGLGYNTQTHWAWSEDAVNFMRQEMVTRQAHARIQTGGSFAPTSLTIAVVEGQLPQGISFRAGPFPVNSNTGLTENIIQGSLDLANVQTGRMYRIQIRLTDVATGYQADAIMAYMYLKRALVFTLAPTKQLRKNVAVDGLEERDSRSFVYATDLNPYTNSAYATALWGWYLSNGKTNQSQTQPDIGANAPDPVELAASTLSLVQGVLPPGLSIGPVSRSSEQGSIAGPTYTLLGDANITTRNGRVANFNLRTISGIVGSPTRFGHWPGIVLRATDPDGGFVDSEPFAIRVPCTRKTWLTHRRIVTA